MVEKCLGSGRDAIDKASHVGMRAVSIDMFVSENQFIFYSRHYMWKQQTTLALYNESNMSYAQTDCAPAILKFFYLAPMV